MLSVKINVGGEAIYKFAYVHAPPPFLRDVTRNKGNHLITFHSDIPRTTSFDALARL